MLTTSLQYARQPAHPAFPREKSENGQEFRLEKANTFSAEEAIASTPWALDFTMAMEHFWDPRCSDPRSKHITPQGNHAASRVMTSCFEPGIKLARTYAQVGEKTVRS